MRAAPTASEAALRRVLRAGRLGVEVRRQVVLGDFIADFFVHAGRLGIEVDGGCHRTRVAADAQRDRKLARMGYRVLRIDAGLVMRDLPEALARIRTSLCG